MQTPAAEVGKILFVEKRRERLHGGMHEAPKTSGPVGQVGNWVFIAFFLYCLRAEMSLRAPGKEKYLLGQLSPFGTSFSLSLSVTLPLRQ
jgi:hypothetical protein